MTQDKKVYYDLVYIASCALKGEQPSLDGMNLQAIKEEAQKDSILPLLGTVVPQFKEAFYKNVYRNSNFDQCKRRLYEFFDKNDILHCSLKGIVVKDFYPQSAMRYMADYDVLFDPQGKEKVRNWLKENNVEILYYREIRKGEKEDSVLFNKQFHFELHYCLLNDGYVTEPWYEYFSNEELFKRLELVSGSEYRMSAEDFYLFFLIHAYKHSSYVCDMRALIDCYLINKNTTYDRCYVNKKLEEFGLLEYETNIRTVSQKIFDREQLSQDEENYFLLCASNGTFGDLQINELRRISKNGEITNIVIKKAIINLFIVPKRNFKESHPFIYYSIVLRPLYHLVHIVKRLANWEQTKSKIDQYRNVPYHK